MLTNKTVRMNADYTIIESHDVHENFEIVLGKMDTKYGVQYVTWEYRKDTGEYYWGHYISDMDPVQSLLDAVNDYADRIRNWRP